MLRIRLRRDGAKKKPFYHVVVSDSRKTPSAAFVEQIGYYDPATEPSTLKLDTDRAEHWVSKGARPSATVAKLIKRAS